jgi:hypothetical protein
MKEVIRQRKKSGLDVKGAFCAAAIEPATLAAI